ncbi:hypothetical protein NP233_g848 [Leucocoprinus birnbaumii]|uniref:Uncharacterized protein n=1 Tax=Leucocoprinus birnbaumii TaxID=56174 RepID=A0AAD5W3J3_9AGAR|nr:hypothetical protein NP233_g848 [Leucocoprinus birnbaumii]
MATSRSLYIDDRDPAITYSSIMPIATGHVWLPFHGAGEEFMQTTTHANLTGSSAHIVFTGSDISVFGSVSPASAGLSDPLTHYILDSNPPFPFRPVPNNDTQYNVTFYQSPTNLTSGLHTLQIVLQSVGNYWLDYMVIDGSPSALSAVVNESITTPLVFQSTSISTMLNQYTLTTMLPTSSALASTLGASTDVSGELIASAVLGGILGFVLLCGLVVAIYRWKSSNRIRDPESVNPFRIYTRGISDRLQMSENSDSPVSSAPSSGFHKNRERSISISHPESPPGYHSPRL